MTTITTTIMKKDTTTEFATLAESIAAFREHFIRGIDEMQIAAEIYAAAIGRWPDARKEFAEALPLTAKEWRVLDRIGHHQVAVRVLMLSSDKTMEAISDLPVPLQEELVGTADSEPVPQKVFSHGCVLEKRISDMNAAEISACIDRRGARIRSVEEQINSANASARRPASWSIRGDVLYVTGRAEIPLEDIDRARRAK